MLELVISLLMSMGYQAQTGTHFIMNSETSQILRHNIAYERSGGDQEFYNIVTIEDVDDVIIVDDTTPKEVK